MRHDGSFFLARRTESPGRSFTSIQMFHTHTSPLRPKKRVQGRGDLGAAAAV